MSERVPKSEKLALRAQAQIYTALALKTIVNIMRTGETDKDRLAAAKEILDRAYGKAIQAHRLEEPTDEDGNEETASNAERFTSAIAGIAARSGKK